MSRNIRDGNRVTFKDIPTTELNADEYPKTFKRGHQIGLPIGDQNRYRIVESGWSFSGSIMFRGKKQSTYRWVESNAICGEEE